MPSACTPSPGTHDGHVAAADSSPRTPAVAAGFALVVFDFDGTLADTFDLFVRAQQQLASRFGFRAIGASELQQARGRSAAALMRASGLARWKLPLVATAYRRIVEEASLDIHCFPGVRRALSALHGNGVQLALVTSNSSRNCKAALGSGLWQLFDHTECGASLFGKHTRLLRAATRLRVPPTRAIYIGDQPTDADAARAAGMAFGAVTWGYATPEAFADTHPDMTFDDPARLESLGPITANALASSP